jgi:hypothetical protein
LSETYDSIDLIDALQAELAKELIEKTVPAWLPKIEAQLKLNGGGDGWYVGSEVVYK